MDCFYAQVHMRDDPSLRGKPVVIGGSPTGRGVVAAASYEARVYGIRSAMPAAQAVKRCAHAIFLKPEFPRYREESAKIFEIFREFTPIVQPASLDEAYLDVSEHLGELPSATAVAQEIRRRVKDERDLTVSVGVGPNRLIAKIASDYHKPDGLTVVRPKQVQRFLDPLPVRYLLDCLFVCLFVSVRPCPPGFSWFVVLSFLSAGPFPPKRCRCHSVPDRSGFGFHFSAWVERHSVLWSLVEPPCVCDCSGRRRCCFLLPGLREK